MDNDVSPGTETVAPDEVLSPEGEVAEGSVELIEQPAKVMRIGRCSA